MDKHSRKILRHIKRKGQVSFDELLELEPNESFCAQTLVNLNMEGYIIQVGSQNGSKRQAIYELQGKGYAVLEEYTNQILIHAISIVISVCALIVSIVALFRP